MSIAENKSDLKEFLETKCLFYNRPGFIESDPIQVPHSFSSVENIEISAFLTAMLSWGQRKTIIKKSFYFMSLLNDDPHSFIQHASEKEILQLESFKHRTFNGTDAIYFVQSLRNIYARFGGLRMLFESLFDKHGNIGIVLSHFRDIFFSIPYPDRTLKHISNVEKNASCKRLNMFLRWMVRDDGKGVDLGLWKGIPSSALCIPLDIHTGNVARALGLLHRQQNDWPAVLELTHELKHFDPADPVKYDFALFGLGIFENYSKNLK